MSRLDWLRALVEGFVLLVFLAEIVAGAWIYQIVFLHR